MAAVAGSSSPRVRREPIVALSTAFEAGGQVAPLDATTTPDLRNAPTSA